MTTSTPALGPIPIGTFVWMTFLSFTIVLILVEREGRGMSITKRVITFACGTMTFVLGLAPQDYVIEYQNGTLGSQTTSLFTAGAGVTGQAILGFDVALFAFAGLQILELLVAAMNRQKMEE